MTLRRTLLAAGAVLILTVLPASAATLFFEEFANNNAGWTLGPQWQIGPTAPSPPGAFGSDPAVDHTPTANNGVAGIIIGGNATQSLHGYHFLTSPTINIASAVGTVTLEFYRWLVSDYPNFMNNKIEVFNGASWVTIWQQPANGQSINDTSWLLQSFDVTAYKNAAFGFRIGHSVDGAGAFLVGSWSVDDVSIFDQSTAVPLPAALPLFAAGLGLMGLVARRKRKQAAAAGV